ncbi:uncharacterized protein FIBRA_03303 [Fibroporia radiculosa]|uniref:Prenylcysteine lyase domain-containing protein n=1 Tax=Fibroporia radiculosa TaxID=599839 RepID=J4H2B9_9APHY|nr:uncharacterized protein FIBRA_03303 [Fibroporia radiculosa]CCM01254.1 predicted protein [Fibroporia radiculosa]
MRKTQLLAVSLLGACTNAFQLPFHLPFFTDSPQTPLLPAEPPSNRIAIIGAGAGGASAAFWIAKAKERYGLDVEVDVFERNGYIGGRSTVVYPYNNTELDPVELGASIFVKVNKNLWRATDEFGLERIDFGDDDSGMAIWDGSEILLETSSGSFYSGWWNTLKIIWRYGFKSPQRTMALVKSMTEQIGLLYSERAPRFDNITALAETLHWLPYVARTAAEYFDTEGIDRRWTREMVDAATRVNYGQNVDAIHALEGMCSLAATGASSVKGGNFQIFEEFLKRSNASVYLNTAVLSLTYDEATGTWLLSTFGSQDIRKYRGVILAAPIHSSAIAFSPESLVEMPSPQPYVHLHVTLLSTPSSSPNPVYFGLGETTAPTQILTSFDAVRKGTGTGPEFNSLTYHGKLKTTDGRAWEGPRGEEYVIKLFSGEKMTDEWLETMFGSVGWVFRKEWDAYPVLPPTTSFPPIKIARGLYYVNAFEPFISTMETETVAARNVVDLLLQDEFNAAVCPPGVMDDDLTGSETFVLGWDC